MAAGDMDVLAQQEDGFKGVECSKHCHCPATVQQRDRCGWLARYKASVSVDAGEGEVWPEVAAKCWQGRRAGEAGHVHTRQRETFLESGA